LVEGGRAGKKFRKNTEGGEGPEEGMFLRAANRWYKSVWTPLSVVTQLGTMLSSYVLSAEFKA
jgi:hypothetical protein